MVLLADMHILSSLPVEGVGWALVLWGIFTLYMWGGAMMLNLSLNLTFLTLFIAFFTLGAGAIYSSSTFTHIGGYFGMLAAFFASYTSFAIVINSIRPNSIPLGPGIGKKS